MLNIINESQVKDEDLETLIQQWLIDKANFTDYQVHFTDSFQVENTREYNVSEWFQRAASESSSARMVKFSGQNIFSEEFSSDHLDQYLELGIEFINNKSADLVDLPVTMLGSNPAILLDRDGIINDDHQYVYQYEDITWVDGVFELIQWANRKKIKVFVITNQSGIARGYYTIDQMNALHDQMDQYLRTKDAYVEKWYFCPYHKDGVGEYQRESLLRKPNPGMALVAQEEFLLDFTRTIMIGDKKSDRLKSLNLKTYFLQGNYSLEDESDVFQSHFEILEEAKKFFKSKDIS